MLLLLKNSHSLTVSVQLAAFNFIPAKFQSGPLQLPLTFGAHACTPPPPFFPSSRITGRHYTCAFISNPGGQGLQFVFWIYFFQQQQKKKKMKRQQFSAWISLWLNPLIILGFPEKERVRWRGMFYSLITPTFTPSCLSVVELLLVALLLYSLESCWDWSYFMLRLLGSQFENSCVSVFTHSCHLPEFSL